MLKQKNVVTFLGYKTLAVIYIGWWLVLQNQDILALILWIVYGSFIVIMFVFSFLWLDTKNPLRIYLTTMTQIAGSAPIILMTAIFFLSGFTKPSTNSVFQVVWLNYYELLHLHNSEEIEALGWALSTDQTFPTSLVSLLLTLACIASIVVVINSKKFKWTYLKKILQVVGVVAKIVVAIVRYQTLHQQESRDRLRLLEIILQACGRRA